MRDYDDMMDALGWKIWKWSIIFTLFFALIGWVGWCIHVVLYPVEQAQRVAELTLNADNVIYNYEWFHQHYADWLAAGANASAKQRELDTFLASAGPVSTWSIATQREANQLRIELSGLRALRVNLANEYNAHTGMANRNLFRSRNLPEHLE